MRKLRWLIMCAAVGLIAVGGAAWAQADSEMTDQVRLEGGRTLQGRIIREDEASIHFKMKTYGVIQIPKYQIKEMVRDGKVAPLPMKTPEPTPSPTPIPERILRSRLDVLGNEARMSNEPTTATLAAAAILNPGDGLTTGTLGAAPMPAAAPGATAPAAAIPAAGTPPAEGAPAPAAPAPVTAAPTTPAPAAPAPTTPAPAAAAPATGAPVSGGVDLAVLIPKLEKQEILEAEETSYALELLKKSRANPGSLNEQEKKAVELLSKMPGFNQP